MSNSLRNDFQIDMIGIILPGDLCLGHSQDQADFKS